MSDMVEKILSLLGSGNKTEAIDVIYDEIDDLLLLGKIDEAASEIHAIAGTDFPQVIYLSALVISRPWQADLTTPRQAVYERINSENKEFADRLMSYQD
jgi:hypothetical protein